MTRPLRIVHFSTAENEGGSGRAAYRIHTGLRRLGHVSRMLVGNRTSTDPDVDTVHGGGFRRLQDRLAEEATRRVGLQYLYYPSARRLLSHPWVREAEIIQLYNTHGGYFSHRILPRLSQNAQVVWRLSDMWPVTGHCAYAGACTRWKTGCGKCPDLGSYPALPVDATSLLWRIKKNAYRRTRLTVVAPSRWTETIARESPLFGGARIERIPNGLDLAVFHPIPREHACAVLGVDPSRKSILFSAQIVDDNPRKGSDMLIAALNIMGPRDDIQVLLAGHGGEKWRDQVPQRVVPLGYLSDDRLIAAANAAADVVAVPSSVENFPNTVIEAMACGTPTVAFDAGGIREAVIEGETGLLVKRGDRQGLADALGRIVGDAEMASKLGAAALAHARREFDADIQTRRFETLYRSLARPGNEARADTPYGADCAIDRS